MGNHRLDYAGRKISEAFARANEQRAKQLAEQQTIQSTQEKLQQQPLTMADLKAQIEVLQNADNGATSKTTIDINSTTDKISDEEYKTMIIQKMITHIKSRIK